MAYALNCADLRCRGDGLPCSSCGGVQGVCHKPHKYTKTIYSVICAAVGAYGIRPELRGFAMSWRWFVVRFMRWRTGRMP